MTSKSLKTLLLSVVAVVLVVVLYTTCTARVPTGYTGILTTFGKVENYTLDAGFHFKNPFQDVVLMDNREQKTSFNSQAFSSDIQQMDIVGSINFSINTSTAMTLYKEVGTNYFSTLVMPRLLENTKAVFSKYTAENLIAARETLSSTIRDQLSEEMTRYGINVVSVSLENIDFTDSFTNAVEQKQVAAQKKLQAEIEQKQKTMETEQQAERQRITAEAEAAVKKIDADAAAYATRIQAEAESEANTKLAASVTDPLIAWTQAGKWDGKLPTYMNGGTGTTLPILNMGD